MRSSIKRTLNTYQPIFKLTPNKFIQDYPRFTVATLLYDEGVSITKLSSLLGHADTATTWHYIRKNSPDEATINAMKALLD